MKKTNAPTDGGPDKREKERSLSPAEQRRLASFEALSETMVGQGWRRTELTVGIVKANVFAVVLLIPLLIVGIGLFLWKNRTFSGHFMPGSFLVFFVLLLVLVVVHELIHGLSWAIFSPRHWKDIEFGVMKQYLTPYCACCVPLSKGQYIFGALMPLVLLGILPMIVGILVGSAPVMFMGVIMADAAAGDILIVWKILRCRTTAEQVLYIDHPTQAGGVLFEK